MHDWLVVVPARLDSTRLPRKPLADLGGKPMIVRVVRNLEQHLANMRIVVATDALPIVEACQREGIVAEMTDASHQSGTDRCHEIAKRHHTAKYILNVQGDEPFAAGDDLRKLMRCVEESAMKNPDVLGTLVYPSHNAEDFLAPSVVKAVQRGDGFAQYFSRAPVPFPREAMAKQPLNVSFLQHLGVYAFTASALKKFCTLAPSPLELIEKLEQLRAIDAGIPIKLVHASRRTLSIDTPEDLEAARAHFK